MIIAFDSWPKAKPKLVSLFALWRLEWLRGSSRCVYMGLCDEHMAGQENLSYRPSTLARGAPGPAFHVASHKPLLAMLPVEITHTPGTQDSALPHSGLLSSMDSS